MRLRSNIVLASRLLISSALAHDAGQPNPAGRQAWSRRRMPNSIRAEMPESTSSSSCPSPSYEACGNGLPDDFCCPGGSTCLSLDSTTTSLCCPKGEDCSAIVPITCNLQQFNVSASPESPVHSLLLGQTPESCGTSSSGDATCCPFGYSCYQGTACIINYSMGVQSSSLAAPAGRTATGATRDLLLWTITPTTIARLSSRSSGSQSQTGVVAGSVAGAVVLVVCLGLFLWAVRKGYCCQTRAMRHAAYKRRLAKRHSPRWQSCGARNDSSEIYQIMSPRSSATPASSRPPLAKPSTINDKKAASATSPPSLKHNNRGASSQRSSVVPLVGDRASSLAGSWLSSKALPAAQVPAQAPAPTSAMSPYPDVHELETPATISPCPPSALDILSLPPPTFPSPTNVHELPSPPRCHPRPRPPSPPVSAMSGPYNHRPGMKPVYATRTLVELPATPPTWRTNFRNSILSARNWISGPRAPRTPLTSKSTESGVFGGMGEPI